MKYAGGVGAVAVLRCADPDFDAMLPIIDSAITAGTWIPIDSLPEQIDFTASCDDDTVSAQFSVESLRFASFLEKISRRTTIKTGDFIIFPPFASFRPEKNRRLTVSVAGNSSLNIKIK